MKVSAKATLALLSSALLVSCSSEQHPGLEYAPDMYHAIPMDPYSQIEGNYNKYNPHGMNLRMPVSGTVARGKMGYFNYIGKDSAEVAGRELKSPLAVTPQVLDEGKVLYSRFCAHCHGESGEGDGLVGQKFKGVPSYTAGRVATLPAGHIYHVITFGKGRMMPHGSQVNPEERWKIVAYVQTLQKGGAADTAATATTATSAMETGAPAMEASAAPFGKVNPVTGYMQDGTLRK